MNNLLARLGWDLLFFLKQCALGCGVLISGNRVTDTERVARAIALLKPINLQDSLMRIGGERDGGYLVPDDLDGIRYCFSPGVSDYAPFEIELEKRGIRSFLADFSVSGPPRGLQDCIFSKHHITGLASRTSTTLKEWMSRSLGSAPVGDLLLQMDIEGSEYEVILGSALEDLARFRIMVIEFHGLHGLFDTKRIGVIELVFAKLSEAFHIVHLHPNNFAPPMTRGGLAVPDLLEVTFLRKDRNPALAGRSLQYPHALDRRSSSIRKDFPLPDSWYRSPT